MRKRTPRALIILVISLIAFLSLTKGAIDWFRGSSVAIVAPAWELTTHLKDKTEEALAQDEIHHTQLENRQLQEEIRRLRNLLIHEIALSRKTVTLNHQPAPAHHRRHLQALKQALETEFHGLSARVIYRSPESWNSTLWVNVGTADNDKLERTVVAKDSPVLVGDAVVGVVDYVGRKQSRVRLITDSGLTPSVRAARDQTGDRSFAEALEQAMIGIEMNPEWLSDDANRDIFKSLLEQCRRACYWQPGSERYLAKGELHGNGSPLWRTNGTLLKGVGFNYDFSDDEGSARDLRSGKAYDGSDGEVALLKVGDRLITTGMDGVFPPGLDVAEVTKIFPLKEGDYFYELEAKPAAGDLEGITDVVVLPPYAHERIAL